MKPHNINKKKNFIAGWYAEDTRLCDELISFFKSNKNKQPGTNARRGKISVDHKIKHSIDLYDWNGPLLDAYYKFLCRATDKYIVEYPASNNGGPWQVLKSPNIQYYPPQGGYFEWHTERYDNTEPYVSRHLAFMTYLNDVTDKGETQFKHQKVKVKPEKGLTLIWPVDWTHLHRGIASPTQEKYIVTGWFNYV